MSAICPECDSDIDIDEMEVDIGDELTCSECGSLLRIANDSPLELELADEDDLDDEDDDDDEEEDDDDEDDDEEDEDDEDEDVSDEQSWMPLDRQGRAPRRHAFDYSAPSSSPSAAEWTAHIWRWRPPAVLGPRALAVTADSPSYPDTHRQLALPIARDFGFAHEFIHTARARAARISRQPREPLLLLQGRAVRPLAALRAARGFAVVVDGNNADDRGDYRPGPPGGPRARRAEPARRGGPDEGRHSRAGARAPASHAGTSPRRPACRRAFRMADEVTEREAAANRAGRRRRFAPWVSASSACGITTRSRASRSRAREMARALEPEINARLVAALKALGYQYVSLDLQGYRLGSLNEALRLAARLVTARRALAALALALARSASPTCRSSPASLEDIDSVNFALGVRDFDVARRTGRIRRAIPSTSRSGKVAAAITGLASAAPPSTIEATAAVLRVAASAGWQRSCCCIRVFANIARRGQRRLRCPERGIATALARHSLRHVRCSGTWPSGR